MSLNKEHLGMFSRNWLFISEETQRKLKEKTILVVGSGLGSRISEIAVRTGFEKLIVADGDKVELSNLNRQFFSREDLDHNKAVALKQNLLRINPNCSITALPEFLDRVSLLEWIPKADIVVNTIDFDSPAFQVCSDLCRKNEKLELFPTNLGFGGSVVVSEKGSPTFSEFFGTNDHSVVKQKILEFLMTKASPYMQDAYYRYLKTTELPDPQLGIAVAVTSALVVTLMVKYVVGEGLTTFPNDFYYTELG